MDSTASLASTTPVRVIAINRDVPQPVIPCHRLPEGKGVHGQATIGIPGKGLDESVLDLPGDRPSMHG